MSLPRPVGGTHTVSMRRRHQRLLARLALLLLVLVAEIVGGSLTHRIDVGRHVGPVSYSHQSYYPFLVGGVKIGVALMLARLAWRFAKARRLAETLGYAPRVKLELSPGLWLAAFVGTSVVYLVQTDAEREGVGRWPLFAPWLHSSALPVFAVLAVVVAIVYRAVERWLGEYELLAAFTLDFVRRVAAHRPPVARPHPADARAPRLIFGLVFESRPPPAARA